MEYKYELIKSQPKEVLFKDIKKYDVARFEYGDYDNWVTAVILDINMNHRFSNPKFPSAEITFETLWGEKIVCYSSSSETGLTIIGTAKIIQKENNNDLCK